MRFWRRAMIPEMTDEEWTSWFESADGTLACPTTGCGRVSTALWDGMNETLRWSRCGHKAFFPESPPLWPPPESHRTQAPAG